jgi:hypothetical protein
MAEKALAAVSQEAYVHGVSVVTASADRRRPPEPACARTWPVHECDTASGVLDGASRKLIRWLAPLSPIRCEKWCC